MLARLTAEELRGADKLLELLLIIFAFVTSMAMALDTVGWDDPVFRIMRRVPYAHYSWAVALAVAATLYAIGKALRETSRWRGRILVTGCLLCATWWMGMALCMSRMVYEMPTRITDLWPLTAFFWSCLYVSRIVAHSRAFSGERWHTNPYQVWGTMFLMLASLSQIIIGVAPSSVFTEIERPVALQLGIVNFVGAAVVMFGLHMRNKETGLNLEFAGSFSLVATLGWYCVTVLQHQPLAGTTLGFSMPEAFVFATLHRGLQIATLKGARRFGKYGLEDRMLSALNPLEAAPPEEPPDVPEGYGRHARL